MRHAFLPSFAVLAVLFSGDFVCAAPQGRPGLTVWAAFKMMGHHTMVMGGLAQQRIWQTH